MTNCIILAGPPGSGKTTYVKKTMSRGDLIVDMDLLYQALSGLKLRDKPDNLLPFVCEARDAVLDLLLRKELIHHCAWVLTTADHDATMRLSQRLNAWIKVFNISTVECKGRMEIEGRHDVDEMVEVCKKWHQSWGKRGEGWFP